MKFIQKLPTTLMLLLAFTPLIMAGGVFFPYISGKAFFIRAIMTLVVLFSTYLFLFYEDFRNSFIEKLNLIKKNPVFVSFAVYFLFFTISTIFAFDRTRAFWGEVERGEGFLMFFFLFLFFIFAGILFDQKKWITFFRFNLITGVILFAKELIEVSSGLTRPGSFTGNPNFLAVYLSFVIMSALFVFIDAKKNKDLIWFRFSILSIITSLVGIFLTETRGVLLGVAGGIFLVLIFYSIQGQHINISKSNLKSISLKLIIASLIFVSIFFVTRNSSFWQKIPGLNRVAQISLNDITTRARLISAQIAMDSMKPKNSNLMRTLFGWGWENYMFAFDHNYRPEFYRYEPLSFDRAHNKIFDVLVMGGFVGLLTYLISWFFIFKFLFKKTQQFFWEKSFLLFFLVAYFIQGVTSFDQISTLVPFFSAVVCVIFLNQSEKQNATE